MAKKKSRKRSTLLPISAFLLILIILLIIKYFPDTTGSNNSTNITGIELTTTSNITTTGIYLSEAELVLNTASLDIPDYSGNGYYIVNDNLPFFDKALLSYKGENFIYTSPLDRLGRCGSCVGQFSYDTLTFDERGDISHIKPSGWQTSKYDEGIVEDTYLYNRCHLLSYRISGLNDHKENLITGTRQFNLAMLEVENFLLDTMEKDYSRSFLYRVTPIFNGNNLVADGVLMECQSLDKDFDYSFCVFIYNVQTSITIDYATGENWLADENTTFPTSTADVTYVANKNSMKFHTPFCKSVNDISERNRWDYTGSREELINLGFTPCGSCKP